MHFKRYVLSEFLQHGLVRVIVNGEVPGVELPEPWAGRITPLDIAWARFLTVPIPDLELSEDGFSCTLSFGRAPFHCVIPWRAVLGMQSEWATCGWNPDREDETGIEAAAPRPKLEIVKG